VYIDLLFVAAYTYTYYFILQKMYLDFTLVVFILYSSYFQVTDAQTIAQYSCTRGMYCPIDISNITNNDQMAYYTFPKNNRYQDGTQISGALYPSSNNAKWETDGPWQGAEVFAGDGATYFTVPNLQNVLAWTGERGLSICYWFQFSASYAGNIFFFGNQYGPFIQIYYAGTLMFFQMRTTGYPAATISGLTEKKWHHLCHVVYNGLAQHYKDGVFYTQNSFSILSYPPVTSSQWIGVAQASNTLQRYITGKVDEFRVFRRVLTAQEVGLLAKFRPYPCPPGTSNDLPNQQVCAPCPPGTYQPSPGQANCLKCGNTGTTWYGAVVCASLVNTCYTTNQPTYGGSITPGTAMYTIPPNTLSFNCPSGTYSPNVAVLSPLTSKCYVSRSSTWVCPDSMCCIWGSIASGGSFTYNTAFDGSFQSGFKVYGTAAGNWLGFRFLDVTYIDSILLFDYSSSVICTTTNNILVYIGNFSVNNPSFSYRSGTEYSYFTTPSNNTLCYTGKVEDRGYRLPLWISCKMYGQFLYIVSSTTALGLSEIVILGQPPCTLCPPGTYSHSTTPNTMCTNCPVGTYASGSGSSSCTACASGTWQPAQGKSFCLPDVPAGYYLSNASSTTAYSTACPAGSYQDLSNQITCKPCGIGFYSTAVGATSCTTVCAGCTWYGSSANAQPFTSKGIDTGTNTPGMVQYQVGGNTMSFNCPSGTYSLSIFQANPVRTTCSSCDSLCCSWLSTRWSSWDAVYALDGRTLYRSVTGGASYQFTGFDFRSSIYIDTILIYDSQNYALRNAIYYIGDTLYNDSTYGQTARPSTEPNPYSYPVNSNLNKICFVDTNVLQGYRNPLTIRCQMWGRYLYVVSPTENSIAEIIILSTPACTLCDPGTYSYNTVPTTQCTQCPAGTYQSGQGKSYCDACSTGTYQSGVGFTSSTNCVAVSDGLIAFYAFSPGGRFKDTTGITGDLSTTSTTLTYSENGPWMGSDSLRTPNVYLPSINLGALSASTGFTFCMWYVIHAISASQKIFQFSLSTTDEFTLYSSATPTPPYLAIRNNNAQTNIFLSNLMTFGVPKHICVVMRSTSVVIYENGQATATNANTVGLRSVTLTLNSLANGASISQSTDEVRIYNRNISSYEVSNIYNFKNFQFNASADCRGGTYCPLALDSSSVNMVGYWSFWTDARLSDATGVTGPATWVGTPSYTANTMWTGGNSATFGASPNYLTLPTLDLYLYSTTTGFSICMWFLLSSTFSYQRVFQFGNGLLTDAIFLLKSNGANSFYFQYCQTSSLCGNRIYSLQDYVNNQWRHICIINKNNIWTMYDYGQPVGSMTDVRYINSVKTTRNFIGMPDQGDGSGTSSSGQFDEIRLYKIALTSDQVFDIYNFRNWLCPAGSYCPTGSVYPIPCPPTTYSTTSGASVCTLCPVTTYSQSVGMSSSDTCLTCDFQAYVCPAGSYCPTGFIAPTGCPAGTWSSALGASSSSTCTSCLAGTYAANTGSSACTSCLTGTYAANTGSSACTNCSVGTYAAVSGSSTCTSCSAGMYTSATGSTVCTSCPVSYSQPDPRYAYCELTPAGYYNPSNVDNVTGLIAHYSFWGTGRLTDATGITGPLTLNGGVTYGTDGKWTGSEYAILDGAAGSANRFTIPTVNLGAMSANNGFSICFWYYVTDFTNNFMRIMEFNSGSNSDFLSIYYQSYNQFVKTQWQNTGSTTTVDSMSYSSNTNIAQWYHMCVTNKNNNWVNYRDGTSAATNTGSVTSLRNVALTVNNIGNTLGNTNSIGTFKGQIDELRIYNFELTSTKVSALYTFRNILPCPAGSFQALAAQDTCQPCGVGYYTSTTANTVCTVCTGATGRGFGSNLCYTGLLTLIPYMNTAPGTSTNVPGTFWVTSGATTMSFNCPSGTYSSTGSTLTRLTEGITPLSAGSTCSGTAKCIVIPQIYSTWDSVYAFDLSYSTYGYVKFVANNFLEIDLLNPTYIDTILYFDTNNAVNGYSTDWKIFIGNNSDITGSGASALYNTGTTTNSMIYYDQSATSLAGYRSPLVIRPQITARYVFAVVLSAAVDILPGEFMLFGAPVCSMCAPGTYSTNVIPTIRCSSCPAGTYASGSGASTCTSCSAGTYSTAIGATSSSTCTV